MRSKDQILELSGYFWQVGVYKMSWTCPGHYKVHVHGRDSPGRPVHGHCPVPLPALIVVAKRRIRKKRTVTVVKTKAIVAVVKRVAVERKRMTKERIRQKVAVQVVLVVKRKRMIAVKEMMMKVIKKKTIRKTIGTKKVLKIRKMMIMLRMIRLRIVTIRMKKMKKQAIGLRNNEFFINNFLFIYFSLILLIFFYPIYYIR